VTNVRVAVTDDGVGIVTLADPERRNALRYEVSRDLEHAVATGLAGGARALVLAAEPPVFCSGGSLDELLEPKAPLEAVYAGFLAVARCPVPTIAAVGGACIGAGVNLPLACDVIVVSPAARFDPRWLDVGIHPGGGHLRRLADRTGRQTTAALVLCGETLDGEGAARAGLAWRCVPDGELLEVATALAAVAARRDPELVRRAKATLDATLPQPGTEAASAVELEAQRWSMARPGFRDGLLRMRDRIAKRPQA
jgi:enoyl-CoA hydratase